MAFYLAPKEEVRTAAIAVAATQGLGHLAWPQLV